MAIAILTTERLSFPNGQASESNLDPEHHRGETPDQQEKIIQENVQPRFKESWSQKVSRQKRVGQRRHTFR